ncbi:unnamed protein product [Euphydryas editha]|nr:unnamed protein product [Euphydryas editha]
MCFKGISERVAILQLYIKNIEISLIQCYAPTESASEEEIEQFYYTVNKALHIMSNKNVIVMGDFNAKIGQPKQDENLITKKYGYGSRNSRGERLIRFAYENKDLGIT